ncbi:MAG: hypothetical protein LBN11_06275 [Tannerella sp.]|jgi:hypothetical protein|nr:hypothetical protein [Tannerella sp.]
MSQDEKKAKELQEDLENTLMEKVGFTKKQLVEFAVNEWIADHLSLLSPVEKQKYSTILL